MHRPLSSGSSEPTGDEAVCQQSDFPGVQVERVERLGPCEDHEAISVDFDVVDRHVRSDDLVWREESLPILMTSVLACSLTPNMMIADLFVPKKSTSLFTLQMAESAG